MAKPGSVALDSQMGLVITKLFLVVKISGGLAQRSKRHPGQRRGPARPSAMVPWAPTCSLSHLFR